MKHYKLCFLGFGNVGRALARLLVAKSQELREQYEIEWEITGVATRRMGWRSYHNGCDVSALLANTLTDYQTHNNVEDWLTATNPDVVFETTSLNPENGQPAINYLKAALNIGAHAISAN